MNTTRDLPREKTYRFEDLSEAAQGVARRDQRDAQMQDFDWSTELEDQLKQTLLLGGLEVSRILWSGFCLQGDGACIEAIYYDTPVNMLALKAERPEDLALHTLIARLDRERRSALPKKLEVRTVHDGNRFYHERTMQVTVYTYDPVEGDEEINNTEIYEVMEALCRWAYQQLETEHDYLMSDAGIDEYLNNMDFEFTKTGELK